VSDGGNRSTPHGAIQVATTVTFNTPTWTFGGTPSEVDGCSECNRVESKPWPIFTINYHGIECCAKCLTAMSLPRRKG